MYKGFVNSAGVDAEGLSGGLWVGWKVNFTVSVLHQSKHLILLSVIDEFQLSWRLALIYGSPSLNSRAAV